MKTKLIIIFALILAGFNGISKNKSQIITVDGVVYEKVNGEVKPLALAYVYLENSEVCTYTNEEGRFNIDLPKGKQTIKIAFKGLDSKTKVVDVKNSTEPMKIVLESDANKLADNN